MEIFTTAIVYDAADATIQLALSQEAQREQLLAYVNQNVHDWDLPEQPDDTPLEDLAHFIRTEMDLPCIVSQERLVQ